MTQRVGQGIRLRPDRGREAWIRAMHGDDDGDDREPPVPDWWEPPRFEKGDRIRVGVGTEDPHELLIDATGHDDVRHVPIYVTINAFGVHQFADQRFIDEHAELVG